MSRFEEKTSLTEAPCQCAMRGPKISYVHFDTIAYVLPSPASKHGLDHSQFKEALQERREPY